MTECASWFTPLNNTSLYYHNIGALKTEEGVFTLIKGIDLSILDDQVHNFETEISNVLQSCDGKKCTLEGIDSEGFMLEIGKLKVELNNIYGLLVARPKRSVEFFGRSLKYMFGTMDADDERKIQSYLQSLGDRQDILHHTLTDSVYLIANMSIQWERLKENQKIQFKNFASLKQLIVNHFDVETKTFNDFDIKTVQLHFENLLLSIQVQIDKLKNAILFLKAGIVDPYLLSSYREYSRV